MNASCQDDARLRHGRPSKAPPETDPAAAAAQIDRRAIVRESSIPGVAQRPADTLLIALLRLTKEFGKPVSELDLRAVYPIPDSGMTVTAFVQTARRLGYRVKRAPFTAHDAKNLPTPFVLLGDAGVGASVALQRDGAGLSVFSPLTRDETELSFAEAADRAGEILLVTPDHEAAETRSWHGIIASRIKAIAVELLIASLIINLFALGSPLFMMTIYNKVIGQRALDTLEVLAIGMVMLYVFDLLLRVIRGYIAAHTGARMDAVLGGEAVHRLVNLPYRHFETTPSGLISERLHQLETIRQFFTGQMPLVLVDLGFVFVFLSVLYFLSPTLGHIVLAAIPVFLGISLAVHRKQKKLVEQSFQALAAKTSTLAESVTNALTFKFLGLEAEIEKRWGERLALSAWTGFKSSNLASVVTTLGAALQHVAGLVIVVVGALSVIDGKLSVGALIAANILAARSLAPMRQVVTAWSQLQEVRAAFARLHEIMGETTESRPGELMPATALIGGITLENVVFSYEQGLPPAVRDVSLTIAPRSIVSIIGPSGSGKSTLAKLILGLYQPDSGRVLLDETDIAHLSPHSFRRQVGVVPQETQLFAGTVRENISIGMPGLDHEHIVQVAKHVGAHDFIQHLPKGYDTVLTERGGGLSAGQRQLLCLTRALVRNPRVLILDEPTSALDSISEERLLRNLRKLAATRTILIISHRPAPLAISDKVAMMVDGTIMSVGTSDQIMELARQQAARARQPEADAAPATLQSSAAS